MATLEHDRAWLRVLTLYHDSVVHVPGLSRHSRSGGKIKPMGLKEAAEIIGLNHRDLSNRLNVNMPEHRPTLEGFVRHLMEGMDMAALDELESAVGRVAIKVPEIHEHDDLQTELMACIKEFGDVGKALQEATDKDSRGGRKITRSEFAHIRHETEETVAQLYELLSAIEQEVVK